MLMLGCATRTRRVPASPLRSQLFKHLQEQGQFDEGRARFYAAELLLAIEHLHSQGIIYR